jgi:hypothetical protein
MVTVEGEAQQLSAALDRTFEYDAAAHRGQVQDQHRVVQVCPLCDARLGLWVEGTVVPGLRRQLFALYDAHRCVSSTDPHTMFERAERALLTAAERIDQLADPELRARAELEADRMAEIAARLRAAF